MGLNMCPFFFFKQFFSANLKSVETKKTNVLQIMLVMTRISTDMQCEGTLSLYHVIMPVFLCHC